MTLIKFYNDGEELLGTQSDEKSLAVWRILRDGPFKAITGSNRGNSLTFTAESTEFGRATWMMEGYDTNTVTFITFNVEHYEAAEESMFHLVPAKTMGGSIRLIRS